MSVTRLKDRKRQAVISKIIGSFFVFLVFVTTFVFIVRLPIFKVQNVVVTGNKVIETSDIEKTVQSVVDKNYFWVIPSATVLFYPKENVLDSIISFSPRIKNVTLDINERVASVNIVERQIYALWCASGDNSACYLLDDEGLFFASAPVIESTSVLRYFGGVASSTKVALGMQFLGTKEAFLDVRFILNKLQSLGIAPSEVYIDPIGSVSVVTKNKTTFLIGRKTDFTDALGRLEATFADPNIPVLNLYKIGQLETLDVRFDGKALFKERK